MQVEIEMLVYYPHPSYRKEQGPFELMFVNYLWLFATNRVKISTTGPHTASGGTRLVL